MGHKALTKLLTHGFASEVVRKKPQVKGSVFISLLLALALALGGCSVVANDGGEQAAGGEGAQSEQTTNASESDSSNDADGQGNIQLQFASGDEAQSGSAGFASSEELLDAVPDYSGSAWVELSGNTPDFTADEIAAAKKRGSYDEFSEFDSLGRCGVAEANVGRDIMPTEKRGRISSVKPTGWHSVKYDNVDGGSLYNRCHLVAHQLTGQNANWKNLITGTRYLNIEGMLPFEEKTGDYVRETGNHVLYRVTPIFSGGEAVARGVQMEGYSLEDDGAGVKFNVYCYNVQPGIGIDYATGDSWKL